MAQSLNGMCNHLSLASSLVLGLDIDYNDATKRASISKWQLQKIPDPDRERKLIRKMIEVQSDVISPICCRGLR